MSIKSRSQQYGSIFGDWHIGKELGSGSHGQSAVFELYRDNEGWRQYSALKVISLIEERGKQETMPLFQHNDYSTASKVRRSQAEQEVRLMDQVRGKTNIVDYLDHKFFDWSDEAGFGTDLLIRMELLTDLRSQMKKGRLTEREIIKIGRDICQALVICHEKKILHRDIKPENIFISKDGDYKLGDFGISRILSNTSGALASTGIGTPAYSAPEQVAGYYDHRVDIYSLGLVLYELCNGNRLPFARSQYITKEEIQIRLAGTPLPVPGAEPVGDPYGTMPAHNADSTKNPYGTVPASGVGSVKDSYETMSADGVVPLDPRLSRIILKACAHKARERYQTAQELLDALCSLDGSFVPPPPTPMWKKILAIAGTALFLVCVLFLALSGKHEHTWIDATCTSPRACEECGETEGSALEHIWLEATCMMPQTCSTCDKTTGSVLEHQWKNATCDIPQYCAVCGATRGEALGHLWTEASFVAPKTCTRCDSTEGAPRSYAQIDVSAEISAIQTIYFHIHSLYDAGKLFKHSLRNGVDGYFTIEGSLVYAVVQRGTDGIGSDSDAYSRSYYYSNGKLIFAFFEGKDSHRLYFYDEYLMRWLYRSGDNDQISVYNDFTFSDEFLKLEKLAKDESASIGN